MAGADAEHVAD